MYDIGICDDGQEICRFIKETIESYAVACKQFVHVHAWNIGEDLKEYLEEGHSLDLLFLDIELFQLNGMDIARYIRNQLDDRRMQIVYISGKESYAQQLFKTQPMDFLVKPISKKQIEESFDLALRLLGGKEDRFRLEKGKEIHYIRYSDVLYFCSYGRKIQIKTREGTEEYYGKLKEIQDELPEDFLRIHTSFIVNTRWITHYNYEQILMGNGEVLNVSQKYRSEVKKFLMRSL